jgi:acetylserotonin N-methyltransferase
VLETLGIKLFARERTLAQYVSWSIDVGMFELLDDLGHAKKEEVAAGTVLTEAGADSLLGIMCALGIISRHEGGTYSLNSVAREYLLKGSPYYIGGQIEAVGYPMPRTYIRGRAAWLTAVKLWLLSLSPSIRYGSAIRLLNQHARNLGACAAAVRTGEFGDVKVMVDIAGGSGAFSIPLALDYPQMRIVMTDLSQAIAGARAILALHDLEQRVELKSLDVLRCPWAVPKCDGMIASNFLRVFGDDTCLQILSEAHRQLLVGGRLWIHEMLWSDALDGPLTTALFHAAMRSAGPGRLRRGGELASFLERVGFRDIRYRPTSEPYSLISGRKY